MKKTIYPVLALLLFVTINCKKENPLVKSLTGTWELRQVGGGVSSKIDNYPAGNGSIYKFTEKTYQLFKNNVLVKSGTYKIIKEESVFVNREVDRIIYDNDSNSTRAVVEVYEGRLYIYSDVYDTQSSVYERIN